MLYGLLFRPYWLGVAGLYMLGRWASRTKWSPLRVALASGVGLALVSAYIYFVLGLPVDHFRVIVNQWRVNDPDAGSLIEPLLQSGGFFGQFASVAAVVLLLAFPIPLMIKGGAYYLFLTLLIATCWFLVIRTVLQARPTGGAVAADRVLFQRSVCLLAAFLCIQGLFEPDYGSALRHLSPLMPLMTSAVWLGPSFRKEPRA
jgi:hypothetical protein